MFYSTFGYAQLAALINISFTAVVAAAGGTDGEKGEGTELKEGWTLRLASSKFDSVFHKVFYYQLHHNDQ